MGRRGEDEDFGRPVFGLNMGIMGILLLWVLLVGKMRGNFEVLHRVFMRNRVEGTGPTDLSF